MIDFNWSDYSAYNNTLAEMVSWTKYTYSQQRNKNSYSIPLISYKTWSLCLWRSKWVLCLSLYKWNIISIWVRLSITTIIIIIIIIPKLVTMFASRLTLIWRIFVKICYRLTLGVVIRTRHCWRRGTTFLLSCRLTHKFY